MRDNFDGGFAALKAVLAGSAPALSVKSDTTRKYVLETKSASPFPQHKGNPLAFGSVHAGKAYVSFHLMALYMNPALVNTISPALKKRMQGKTCFNFKSRPEPEILHELTRLTDQALAQFGRRGWL